MEPRKPDTILPLHPAGVPAQLGTTPEDNPWLELYRPEQPTGAAVLVCPGGGYGMRAAHEGAPIALWLNTLGITAIVVHYRVKPYKHPQPLNDVMAAMTIAKANAKDWNIDPARIGVLGFSAGGHLAASLSVHYTPETRPALSILLYPVITFMDVHTHSGSRTNLLGEPLDMALVEKMSNERQVNAQTPPAFIFHTADDAAVPVENAILYAGALRKSGVPFELHVYETGSHGVGLATSNPVLSTWPMLCGNWLRAHGWAR